MTITRLLPVLFISVGLAGGTAVAQSASEQTDADRMAIDQMETDDNPNAEIVRQIEDETGEGDAAPTANTLGEAAATAQTEQPIGSGAAVEWVGKPIAAVDGTKVGTVSEVKIDGNGAVTEIHAKIGGLFGLFAKEVAIPAERIILERDGMIISELSQDDINAAPRVNS
ncbi:PRC-barrel domain-containing protein [Microbaculum marinum]|uniref:PRC-barrel domain-containing protein n=1 Tax=Microbaculum marinum TaxID=1764581 RepID=A0AAW9RR00_9HYPH